MNIGVLFHLAITFGLLSLLAIGGANATLPEIHREVVDQLHWMDNATFANLVAIGQTAPGPNVLIVSLVGWQVAGLAGLLVATLAIILPSSTLAIAVDRFMRRNEANESLALVRRALAPIAIGLMLASGVVTAKAAYTGVLTLTITALMCAMIYFTRLAPLWGIAAGAILGIAAYHSAAFF